MTLSNSYPIPQFEGFDQSNDTEMLTAVVGDIAFLSNCVSHLFRDQIAMADQIEGAK